MSHYFYIKNSQTEEICNWCEENLGSYSKEWNWAIRNITEFVYQTVVVIYNDEDAAFFKLTWGDD